MWRAAIARGTTQLNGVPILLVRDCRKSSLAAMPNHGTMTDMSRNQEERESMANVGPVSGKAIARERMLATIQELQPCSRSTALRPNRAQPTSPEVLRCLITILDEVTAMPHLALVSRTCVPAIVLATSACGNVGAGAAGRTPHCLAMSKMQTLSVQPAAGELTLVGIWRS